jgi:hypothetical protein
LNHSGDGSDIYLDWSKNKSWFFGKECTSVQVLQELQKKYVRLEMALQYSLFEGGRRGGGAVPPIQETPSLTLSESDPLAVPAPADDDDNR